MRIRILSIGKVKQSFVLKGEAEYLKRLQGECSCEIVELDNSKLSSLPPDQQKLKEADLLRGALKNQEDLILLDESGKQFASAEMASWIAHRCSGGRSSFCFAIGGPHGWAPELKQEASLVWSLSKLTFPYQLARLIVVEQVYRALSITKGYPYHK